MLSKTVITIFAISLLSGCHKNLHNDLHGNEERIVVYCDSSYLNKRKYKAYQFDNGDDYIKEGMYRIIDERGKIGYADEDGNIVIQPRFAFGFPFENGIAKVTDIGCEKEVPGSRGEYHYWDSDNWYYIDKTGRKVDYK